VPTLQATQTRNQFKVGDPVLYEFREMKVERLDEDGFVVSVRDDYFSIGCGRQGNVFPMSEEGQKIAFFFKKHEDYLHLIDGVGGGIFNWPSVAGYLENLFDLAMFALYKGESVDSVMAKANGFVSLAVDYHDRAKAFCVDGVYVIGRW